MSENAILMTAMVEEQEGRSRSKKRVKWKAVLDVAYNSGSLSLASALSGRFPRGHTDVRARTEAEEEEEGGVLELSTTNSGVSSQHCVGPESRGLLLASTVRAVVARVPFKCVDTVMHVSVDRWLL